MKLLIIILFLIPSLGNANTNVKLGKGRTEFLAVGNPGFLKIKGKGSAPEGRFEVSQGTLSGAISIDLSSLDTGMSLRNTHMKEKYLKVDQFPKAKLEIKGYKIDPSWSLANPTLKSQKIPGTLTIHGESHPVVVTTNINSNGEVDSSFELKITDFKIEIPSFMGVTVADTVTVNINSMLVATNDK